jgi:hypothetical protein
MEHNELSRVGAGRVGLVVARMQPPHRGHVNLVSLARSDCDVTIVAFGSTQLSGVVRHPFTYAQRCEMLQRVVGDTVQTVPLVDIDSNVNTDDWVDYVLDKLHRQSLPEPTDYYTGSVQDAKWYVNRFARLDDPVMQVGFTHTYTAANGKRLHILDRSRFELPPAEEIRSLIERRDPEWKAYVPARLIDYIEWTYPPDLRTAIPVTALPEAALFPVGTRVVLRSEGQATLYRLHDDGKWRPIAPMV